MLSEYEAIKEFYGERKAARSGVPYINHILEGCAILTEINASSDAKRAFAIHPMCQDDSELIKFDPEVTTNRRVLMLAMEYRSIANGYLSFHYGKRELKLSPLVEVNQMLIADKVQNYKDFLLYHAETHPNREVLSAYFNEWLIALGIDKNMYNVLAEAARKATA